MRESQESAHNGHIEREKGEWSGLAKMRRRASPERAAKRKSAVSRALSYSKMCA